MAANNGVGVGNAGLLQEKEAFDRLIGSLMRGIAQTCKRPGSDDFLVTVRRLRECGNRAYGDNDRESLEHVLEVLKSIRLY